MTAVPAPAPPLPVILSGFGPVGQDVFTRLRRDYPGQIRAAAIRGRTVETVPHLVSTLPARSLWKPLTPIAELLQETGAWALIQAIPSSGAAHARAVEESLTALHHGVHVVTATKSHLLTHWRELEAAAQHGRSRIRISGATGAALPAADLARSGVQGLGCRAVRSCPNGTSTFVLDRMGHGMSLADAVLEAQRLGIAEADPSADLTGTDAATKTRLLAGMLWGWDVARIDVDQEAIDGSTAELVTASARTGHRLRAVATASVDRPYQVCVRLEPVTSDDPLFHLSGPEKAMTFLCPEAGDITVHGGRSSPAGAGLALVKDVLNLLRAQDAGF